MTVQLTNALDTHILHAVFVHFVRMDECICPLRCITLFTSIVMVIFTIFTWLLTTIREDRVQNIEATFKITEKIPAK